MAWSLLGVVEEAAVVMTRGQIRVTSMNFVYDDRSEVLLKSAEYLRKKAADLFHEADGAMDSAIAEVTKRAKPTTKSKAEPPAAR